jgi:hypothetical protein
MPIPGSYYIIYIKRNILNVGKLMVSGTNLIWQNLFSELYTDFSKSFVQLGYNDASNGVYLTFYDEKSKNLKINELSIPIQEEAQNKHPACWDDI